MDKSSNIPIIFIHYSNSAYLEYTLDLAKKKNPDKRIILLGDKTNRKYEKLNIEHFYFDDYFKGPKVENFEKGYKFIAGAHKRKKYWTNFVFKRWFCIYNFIKQNKIERFWTFDSDTLILKSLQEYERKLEEYDCTEQCNGSCMNGLINNINVVEGYINKINELFKRGEYLHSQEKDFEDHPDWAFTEMRAYETYKIEEKIKSIKLNRAIENETFDDCISQEHRMEQEYSKKNKNYIKKLYFEKGKIYEYDKIDNKKKVVNTINMSWVNLSEIEKIYFYSLYGKMPCLGFKLKTTLKKIIRVIKRKF